MKCLVNETITTKPGLQITQCFYSKSFDSDGKIRIYDCGGGGGVGWWKEEQQRRFLVQVVHGSGEHLKLDCLRLPVSLWQWTGYYHFGNLGFSVLG